MQRVCRTSRRAKTGVWVCFLLFCCAVSSLLYMKESDQDSDLTKGIRKPLRRDQCSKLSFSRTKLPVTALASFQGSGSIWLRHLLQRLTGIATGSAYKSDEEMLNLGFPGEERKDGTVIAINTHSNFNGHKKYNKVLLLIRNPFEALLAEFRRISTYERVGHHSLEKFVEGWNDFCNSQIKVYRDLYVSWTKHPNVLPVFHDNLSSDLKHSLIYISSFIKAHGFKLNIKCGLGDPGGVSYQNQSQVLPSDYFYSKSQIDKINETIMELHKVFSTRFNSTKLDNMKRWVMK